VDKLAVDTAGNAVDPSRCKPAELVEHGHTTADHAAYAALWNLAGPPDRQDEYRDVAIGYDKLAALVGGSKRNIQRLAEILKRKLAIEVVREEKSGLRQGKTYRVYGMAEILRRRKEAGYVWAFRNSSAVELVKIIPVDRMATVANLPPDTVDKLPPSAGGSLGSRNEEASPLRSKLVKIMLDDDTAQKLIRRCRAVDAAATEEEILHFLELREAQLRRQRPPVDNWREVLLASVSRYFQRPALELERYRAEHGR
jgi:hypothetical protein